MEIITDIFQHGSLTDLLTKFRDECKQNGPMLFTVSGTVQVTLKRRKKDGGAKTFWIVKRRGFRHGLFFISVPEDGTINLGDRFTYTYDEEEGFTVRITLIKSKPGTARLNLIRLGSDGAVVGWGNSLLYHFDKGKVELIERH